MRRSLLTKLAAMAVTAAMAFAVLPAAALASAPAPDPNSAVGDSLVDPDTRQQLTDLYDSASALLAMHGNEMADDVRLYLEGTRSHAYQVLMYGGYEGHYGSIAEMRVSVAVAEANLAGTEPNTLVPPPLVIGTAGYNRTTPLLVSANMANTVATIYATTRNLPPEMVRDQIIGNFVERVYVAALGRNIDPAGRDYWVNSIVSGERTPDDVIITILQSQEFNGRNLSDEAYVTALYQVFFDRNPDTTGLNNWVAVLRAGTSRADLVQTFTTTQEWHNICTYYGL